MVPPRSPAAAAVLALALVALSAGCGKDEAREGPPFEPANIEDQQSLLITNSDIEEVGPATPYGAALRWWQALQLADVQGVRRSYTARIPRRETQRQILTFPPRFSQPIDPEVERRGNRATMDVTVRTALSSRATPSIVRIVDFPARFNLLRKAAGWKLFAGSYRNFIQARPFLPQPGG
jgi:hypothetical protein